MKNKNLLRLLGVIGGGVLLLVAFFLFFAPFLTTDLFVVTGYDLTFGNAACAGITTAWVFSLILAVAALCVICFFVLDLAGVFHLKAFDNKIVRLGLACCFVLLGLVTGILLFCVRPLFGTSSQYVAAGAGAIVGGILTILGGCCMGCGTYLLGK